MTSVILRDPTVDADGSPTYTQVLGEYSLPVQGQAFTMEITKVSIRMKAKDGTVGHRVLKLSLGRGKTNLVYARYEWPCVTIDYSHFDDVTPSVKIDFIGNFGGPQACVLSPDPKMSSLGTLNLYTSISMSIIDTFFPGVVVYLQDAATADVAGDKEMSSCGDTYSMALSAVKLFAGNPNTSYGGFGFFSRDRPAQRIAAIQTYFNSRTVRQAVDEYVSDYRVRNFFFFLDHNIDIDTDQPEKINEEVNMRVQMLEALSGRPFSLTRSFADVTAELVAMVKPPIDQTIAAKNTRMAARKLFNYLQELFLGNFFIRLQKRVPGAWEAFKQKNSIGPMSLMSIRSQKREVQQDGEEFNGPRDYSEPIGRNINPRTLATEKTKLAARSPAFSKGPAAIASWLPIPLRVGPAAVAARTLRRTTPYDRPTGVL